MDPLFTPAFESRSNITLPSLRSLNLPLPRIGKGKTRETTEILVPVYTNVVYEPSVSTSSISSKLLGTSNTFTPLFNKSAPSSGLPPRFRLVRCSFEVADAILVFPEPLEGSTRTQGKILIGHHVNRYRDRSTRPARSGFVVYPYKITPSRLDIPEQGLDNPAKIQLYDHVHNFSSTF